MKTKISLLVLASAIVVAGVVAFLKKPVIAAPEPAGSAVKVIVDNGHGSAVHIGGGFFLTAAHVVTAAKTVTIKTDIGATVTAEVLWINSEYDVALLRVETPAGIAASPLACRAPVVGEHIEVRGNPRDVEFARTWGRISAKDMSLGIWRVLYVADVTAAPGNSGGPVFAADGSVIGILVAGYPQNPIAFIVPGSALCTMLARPVATS